MKKHENPHIEIPGVADVWDEGYEAGYKQGLKDLDNMIGLAMGALGCAVESMEGRHRGKDQSR